MSVILSVNNIEAAYGDATALFDVSIKALEGQITSVIGSNGAGKSTLLRSIMGLMNIQQGSIFYFEKQIQSLKTEEIVRLGISLVPEGRKLFPRLTVTQNLFMGGYINSESKQTKEKMEEMFQIFPRLRERHKQLAGTLSGGEQQMVAIARGLMSSPKILLVDEMSLGLAPIIVEELFDLLKKIRQSGITILLVEQDVSTALSIADRAYVMQTGTIVLEGSAKDIKNSEVVQKAYLGI